MNDDLIAHQMLVGVEEERDRLRAERDAALSEAAALRERQERLVEALRKWGQHDDDCGWWEDTGQPSGMDLCGGLIYDKPDCTCGLAAALAGEADDDQEESR